MQMVEKIFRELGLFDNFPLDVKKVRAFTNAVSRKTFTLFKLNQTHNMTDKKRPLVAHRLVGQQRAHLLASLLRRTRVHYKDVNP